LIDAVAEKLPQQFICLDRGFQGNDQLKANSVQTFNALNESKDKDSKIIFRTV
jgi:adenine-specific DNA-methyltransferase